MRALFLVPVLAAVLGTGVVAACGCQGCKRHGEAASTSAVAKVKDPVCGMEVDPASAVKTDYKGKTYYFCSDDCKQKFEKNPAQYAVKQAQPGK